MSPAEAEAALGAALGNAAARRRSGGRVLPDGLTDREGEVLRLIADGLSNAEIAASPFVAETTVTTHINNAFAKIDARNLADAVRYAFRNGLARP